MWSDKALLPKDAEPKNVMSHDNSPKTKSGMIKLVELKVTENTPNTSIGHLNTPNDSDDFAGVTHKI